MKLFVNGDSWTYGCELEDCPADSDTPSELSFGALMGRTHGLEYTNYASNGHSNFGIARETMIWLTEYLRSNEPKDLLVVLGWTFRLRWEYWQEDIGQFVRMAPVPGPEYKEQWEFYLKNFQSEYFDYIQYAHNILLIQNFLKNNGIKYLFFKIDSDDHLHHHIENFSVISYRDIPIEIDKYDLSILNLIDYTKFIDITMAGHINKSLLDSGIPQSEIVNHYMSGGHPNAYGHKLWAELLWEKFNEQYG